MSKVDSDLCLVRLKTRQKLAIKSRKATGDKNKAYNVEELKKQGKLEEFKDKLRQAEKVNDEDDIEDVWEKPKKTIKSTAQDVLGGIEGQRRNDWFDEKIGKALGERNKARCRMLQRPTRNNLKEYKERRRNAKTIIRRKKREFLDEIQNNFKNKQIGKFYKNVDEIKKGYQPRL
ncbi:hypothetical protein L798_08319 [Zootermopsis nevadensis]|uniref:Uncharacterized protein n=1 Tax=Zootermopsis nevadensis TaxID=136037 RepID=A0A067R2G9_ZOONE|nr:hypothetical protein L798_08319 [Zootermopsis nevadensis]